MPTTYAYAGKPPGLTGRYHWGRGAIGVPGASIPLTGQNGPSLIGLDITHPGEDADEFRVLVLTVPPALTRFECDEYGRVIAQGPDGTHVGLRRGYKNGQPYAGASGYGAGEAPFTIYFGSTLAGAADLDGIGAAGSLIPGTVSQLAGAAALDDLAAGGQLVGSGGALGGAATLDGVGAGGTLAAGGVADLAGTASLDGLAAAGVLASAFIITQQPRDVTAQVGAYATFEVTAAGATGYQWRRGGVPITGATRRVCTTPPVQLNEAGNSFDVVVSGGQAALLSTAAVLTVTAAPTPRKQPALDRMLRITAEPGRGASVTPS